MDRWTLSRSLKEQDLGKKRITGGRPCVSRALEVGVDVASPGVWGEKVRGPVAARSLCLVLAWRTLPTEPW